MDFRKIVVGGDIKNGFHFTIGQKVLDGTYTVNSFKILGDRVKVYIEKDKEVQLWWDYPISMVSFQESIIR